MCFSTEPRSASTGTCGGRITAWADAEDDEMYSYVELTEIILTRPKRVETDGSGDKNRTKLPMRKSLFAHVPPYVIFHLYSTKKSSTLPPEITKYLSWRHNAGMLPQMVRKTLAKSGFWFTKWNNNWCGNWGPPMSSIQLKTLKSFQKVNHIPGILELSHKDRLWRSLRRMIERFGRTEYDFTPMTYILPEDTVRFQKYFRRLGGVWITKPPTGCGGNGIRVVSQLREIPKGRRLVVQRYIAKPRLIRGVKFDLRLYALVTSPCPLKIYFYTEGLVRFATAKYLRDVCYLFDKYMHLTNTSVNKTSPVFRPNDSLEKHKGNMWSLKSLWSYLAKEGHADIPKLWGRIKDVVIKTIVAAEDALVIRSGSTLPSYSNAFQLLGFDVILDENLKPWLLEVNNYPSMDPDTPLCSIVKGQLAKDVLNMIGLQIPNIVPDEEAKSLSKKYVELSFCQGQNGLDTKTLSDDEKDKQNRFANVEVRGDYLKAILDFLTPDDVRHLISYEDELVNIGAFEKIFPTKSTHVYHKFFGNLRYYNKLFDAWEATYGEDKPRGISRLQKLCKKKFHLPDGISVL